MINAENLTSDSKSFVIRYSLFNSFLTITVLNSILVLPTVIGNFFIVLAIQRTPNLQTPSNFLLCSLAVSDICVGIFALPLRLSRTITLLLNLDETELKIHPFTLFASIYLSGVSVFTITAISLDRFLSLYLHLRYNTLVTPRRIVLVIVKIWVTVVPFSLVYHWSHKLFQSISAFLTSIMLAIVVFCYINIYRVVRRHQRQIQAICPNLQPKDFIEGIHLPPEREDSKHTRSKSKSCSSSLDLKELKQIEDGRPCNDLNDNIEENTTAGTSECQLGSQRTKGKIPEDKKPVQMAAQLNIASFKKTVLGSFYVCILFFVCSSPYLISKVCLAVSGTKRWTIEANEISVMIIFTSSALNPLIYCCKMRNLRAAVRKIYIDFVKSS